MGWHPVLARPVYGMDALYALWAKALTVTLRRPVRALDVYVAIRVTEHWDPGLGPAVARWKAVPASMRFCPPGIARFSVTEADVRMWLKVGAILERAS
jgi:hypothetical protein